MSFGGITQLATLSKDSRHAQVRTEVAGALWALSEGRETKVEIAAAQAVAPLVALLGNGDDRAHEHAAGALLSLALDNQANQGQVTRMLIELLSSGSAVAQERAAAALWALNRENPLAHEGLAKSGDPAALVQLLRMGIPAAREYALWSLSLSITAESQQVVADAGGVQPLVSARACACGHMGMRHGAFGQGAR